MQTQEDHSNPISVLNVDSLKVDLVVIQNTCSEKEDSNSETASRKLVKECSLNSETKDVHAIKYKMSKAKEICMAYFRSLHSHLQKAVEQNQMCKMTAAGQQHTEQLEISHEGRVDQYPEQCQVQSPMLDSSLDNQTTEYSKQSLERESIFAKPDHMIASSESRNSSKNMPRFSSNDMVYNHYLDEARKKTQEKDRNSKTSVMPFARFQNTTNGSKQKPRSNNQTTRSLPAFESSCVTSNVVPLVDHSRNSSSFSDSKHFVCSTCHKCVFNANHDACITKLLKEVNSCKAKSHKTRNSNKPVEQKSHTQPPGRQIFIGHRWVPKGKIFTSCTSKADSESTHGSKVDISKLRECKQTLDLSACLIPINRGLIQAIPTSLPPQPIGEIFLDYRVTLGFGSTGGLDLACPIIRLSSQYGIQWVLGRITNSLPGVGTNRSPHLSLNILKSIDMEDDVDINALTIEQYMDLIPGDIKPAIVNPKIGDDVEFKINANFMRELRRKLFAGIDDEVAY
ncbi:hypothetical protein Tco_0474242 [Tanacetum coccineum]